MKQKPSTCSKGRRVFQPISIYQKIEVYIPLSIIRWDKDMFYQPESIYIRKLRSTYPSLSSAGTRIRSASHNQETEPSQLINAARAVKASAKLLRQVQPMMLSDYQGQVQTQQTMQWRFNMNKYLTKIKCFASPVLSQEN